MVPVSRTHVFFRGLVCAPQELQHDTLLVLGRIIFTREQNPQQEDRQEDEIIIKGNKG